MGFYAFCQKAGFKNYYGLEEYDNDKDFDGSWGIYDEPFLQYFATQIKKEKNPYRDKLFKKLSAAFWIGKVETPVDLILNKSFESLFSVKIPT